jgi:hypothetical protein
VRPNKELALSLVAIVAISGLYVGAVTRIGLPAASGFLGHSLGVFGFGLMVMTETLYSLRKRAVRRPWGTMRSWLQFHIFTGIVGPFLVVLHSAWAFQGLAGVATLLTLVVVVSGFVGRYIYTAVPRTADGVQIEANLLEKQVAEAKSSLMQATGEAGTVDRKALRADQQRLKVLERQLGAMRWSRRMLAVWHTVHIPLGMVLFVTAIAHAAAAMYYATLLR